jgi:hypothetical protein
LSESERSSFLTSKFEIRVNKSLSERVNFTIQVGMGISRENGIKFSLSREIKYNIMMLKYRYKLLLTLKYKDGINPGIWHCYPGI